MEYKVQNESLGLYFDILKCVRFSALFFGCPTHLKCLSKCPDESFDFEQHGCNNQNIDSLRKKMHCGFYTHHALYWADCSKLKEYIKEGKCAAFYLPSDPSRCMVNCCHLLGVTRKYRVY